MNAPHRLSLSITTDEWVGHFDPARFHPPELPGEIGNHLDIPGLSLAAGRGELARSARYMVMCIGTPQFHDSHAKREAARSTAHGWLKLCERHGERFLQHAGGDFAVFVLDIGQCTATLATDRFSHHPIYYRATADALAFGLRAGALSAAIDPQAIYEYFHAHVIGTPRSVYADVMRLPAASCLIVSRGGQTLSRHWLPQFEHRHRSSTPSLASQFRKLVKAAVARRAGSTRTGCFLSGGTDSSTVVGMLSRITGARVPTFSIGFDVEGYDELDYAQIAAAHFDCAHHAHSMRAEELLTLIPALARHTDQPFGNSSLAPTFLCARLAREHGIDNMLAGDGGDELFGGNTRYASELKLARMAQIPGFFTEGLKVALAAAPNARLRERGTRFISRILSPLPDRLERHNLMREVGPDTVFTPEFAGRINPALPLERLRRIWAQNRQVELIDSLLAYDWQVTLADNDLPKVRQATSLAGVSARFPLLDDQLVDFSLQLAPALKVRGGDLRVFFKYALRNFLPERILKKKKHGFGLPFGPWLLTHAGLNAMAVDALESLEKRGLWRSKFAHRLMTQYLPQHPGYYGELAWLGVMLEHWLRAHDDHWRV